MRARRRHLFCQNKSSIYYANENMKVLLDKLVAVGKDLKSTSKMTNMSIKAIGYRLKHKQRSRGDEAIVFENFKPIISMFLWIYWLSMCRNIISRPKRKKMNILPLKDSPSKSQISTALTLRDRQLSQHGVFVLGRR